MDITLNGRKVDIQSSPDTPLLWVLRDELNLTGTKFGCGVMSCGACTVHVDGQAQRSCLLPVSAVAGKSVTTIEGLAASQGDTKKLHAVQSAWIEHQVPQCGYCQSGAVMAAASLLAANAKPSDADIDAALANICRCGTYDAMRAAVHAAAASLSKR